VFPWRGRALGDGRRSHKGAPSTPYTSLSERHAGLVEEEVGRRSGTVREASPGSIACVYLADRFKERLWTDPTLSTILPLSTTACTYEWPPSSPSIKVWQVARKSYMKAFQVQMAFASTMSLPHKRCANLNLILAKGA